jgi:plastocyanin
LKAVRWWRLTSNSSRKRFRSSDDAEAPATDNSSQTENDNDTSTEDNTDNEEVAVDSVTIIYGNSGFSPSSYTIASGGTVTVQNNSDEVLDLKSNDHPVHTDNTELNIGEVNPGESKTFTLERTGTWGFHNHERDSHTGTITVE